MTNLQLSTVLKVGVSTYENYSMDTVVEQMGYDLEECSFKKDGKKMIEVEGVGAIPIDDIDCDDNLDFDNFKKELASTMQSTLEDEVRRVMKTELGDIFKKYGMKYNGMNFYTPKYYNYEGDSLDIRLKCIDDDRNLEKYGLRELIEKYIEEVRQESYDGYCSFEPTNVNEVNFNDYCVLWAILQKEEYYVGTEVSGTLYDLLKECLQDFVDEGYSELTRGNTSPMYRVRVPNGKKKIMINGSEADDWDFKDFKLDFDNKLLVPVE